MNVRLEYEMNWLAALWFESRLQVNEYRATISMYTNTSNQQDHVTCMERINHFVYHELTNTVFIKQHDQDQIHALSAAGIKITPLPEEPIDQIVGIALYCKLNAILEGRMIVIGVVMQSNLGDNVRYLHSDQESLGPCDQPGWWSDAGPTHSNFKPTVGGKRRVVKLNRTPSWRDLELDWTDSEPAPVNSNTVVFKFPPDEK